MDCKRVSGDRHVDNIEIRANEVEDISLILEALRVYRNALDTHYLLDEIQNPHTGANTFASLYMRISKIDEMTATLRRPQPIDAPQVANPAEPEV